MPTCGTIAILRTLMNAAAIPPGIRRYREWQLQRAVDRHALPVRQPSRDHVRGCALALLIDVGASLAGAGLCVAVTLVVPLLMVFSGDNLLWMAVTGGLIIVGSGAALSANGINRVIARTQRTRAWDLLLLLPYDRAATVLGWAERGFTAVPALFALFFTEFAALMLTVEPERVGAMVLLAGLVLVEAVQLLALGAAAGIAGASGRSAELAGVVPALFGVIVAVGRATGGLVVAQLAGWGDYRLAAALLAGPLSAVAVPGAWVALGLAIAAVYLLALEGLVRVMFAWGLDRLGEGA